MFVPKQLRWGKLRFRELLQEDNLCALCGSRS